MSADESWFRNVDWSPAIAERFEAALRQTRDPSQFLRIQATSVAPRHPEVALQLLERYFALPVRLFDAWARELHGRLLVDRGDGAAALQSYLAALEAERLKPHVVSRAHLRLAELVLRRDDDARYLEALAALQAREGHTETVPDEYARAAASAQLCERLGDALRARDYARAALDAASRPESGIGFAGGRGLIREQHGPRLERLRRLALPLS
jgi:tetratricopeptide (TPR) repeat protein